MAGRRTQKQTAQKALYVGECVSSPKSLLLGRHRPAICAMHVAPVSDGHQHQHVQNRPRHLAHPPRSPNPEQRNNYHCSPTCPPPLVHLNVLTWATATAPNCLSALPVYSPCYCQAVALKTHPTKLLPRVLTSPRFRGAKGTFTAQPCLPSPILLH